MFLFGLNMITSMMIHQNAYDHWKTILDIINHHAESVIDIKKLKNLNIMI